MACIIYHINPLISSYLSGKWVNLLTPLTFYYLAYNDTTAAGAQARDHSSRTYELWGRGINPKVNVVKEVAWIVFTIESVLYADKGEWGSKHTKNLRTYFMRACPWLPGRPGMKLSFSWSNLG